ncbi:putative glutamine amidotransferase [Branchiibius hedensis]|uniref:Predicted glutamine amidotransferase n=1 Tax=Branchiibius hedensis TaxID=672460 RepID=A0A2Y8ZQZ2_9MICO|nr:class II glutamine amidotransferase [Branchiibius hedensis]PWJ24942.1 putative glutamine amidotransferase [Branchiibius hedensis]SSA33758.1 Predicted glutamine amidotransferase [Branchiibius hedensis]
MCRLLAHATPTALTTRRVLGAQLARRFERMSLLHDDGWGSAWVDAPGGSVHRVRDASPAHTQDRLRRVLESDPAAARIVHLRLATDSMAVTAMNAHPFSDGTLALAHNGSIVPTDSLQRLLTDDERAGLTGTTDSEMYFTLLRRHLSESGDLRDAAARTVRALRSAYPEASLNAVALTADSLCVIHSSSLARVPWEDFMASGLSTEDMPLDHSEVYFRMSYRAVPGGGWVFTSTGLGSDSWTALPEDSISTVDLASLQLSIDSQELAA